MDDANTEAKPASSTPWKPSEDDCLSVSDLASPSPAQGHTSLDLDPDSCTTTPVLPKTGQDAAASGQAFQAAVDAVVARAAEMNQTLADLEKTLDEVRKASKQHEEE